MARKILRDAQWDRIKDLLPGKAGDKGMIATDNRLFIEAVLWLLRTGAPWRDLPPEFGRWHTAYMRFTRWHRNGVWKRLFEVVRQNVDLEAVFIDSTAIRAHQHAAGAPKKTVRSHWVDLVAAGAPNSI
jgi:putative transposase